MKALPLRRVDAEKIVSGMSDIMLFCKHIEKLDNHLTFYMIRCFTLWILKVNINQIPAGNSTEIILFRGSHIVSQEKKLHEWLLIY